MAMSPVEQVLAALRDEGPSPAYHRALREQHRREWPTLWAALERLEKEPQESSCLG